MKHEQLIVKSATIAFLALALAGCQKKSDCVKNGVVVEIAGNHGHEVAIPTQHVEQGVGGMYPIKGGTHEHAMSLTDDNMKALKEGQPVTTRTTTVQGHVHEISVSCKP